MSRPLVDPESSGNYLTNAGVALSERSRWERTFHAELVNAYADEPTTLVASILPARLTERGVAVLSRLATLPSWARDFVRSRQFGPRTPQDTTAPPPEEVSAQDIADALAPTLATAAYAQHVLTLLAARGIDYKQWVTRHDPLVRDTHRKADKQVVRLSQPFVVGGALMQHPADSRTAPIGEWINDRCVIIGRPDQGSTR